jgi:meiosis-specific transcription factor NDT80
MRAPSHSSSGTSYGPASFAVQDRPHYQGSNQYISRHTYDLFPRSSRSVNDQGDGNPASPIQSIESPLLSPNNQYGDYRVRPQLLARAPETSNIGPPLEPTTVHCQIISSNGQAIVAELNARIDKGFFLADQNWTCYRRNYFSVTCSFTLRPQRHTGPLYLLRSGPSGSTESILSFAMTISAVVDGPAGKQIELVQHTPKRDKGPQGKPDRVKLQPSTAGSELHTVRTPMSHHTYAGFVKLETESHHYSKPSVANFERIQFKSATQNNGRRRAAQQYYHLIIELHAEGAPGPASAGGWVKVASRRSVPMVVRGRSPGHYQDDRRSSSSSTGLSGSEIDSGSNVSQIHSTGSFDYTGVDDSLSVFSSSGSSYTGSDYNGQGHGYYRSLNCSPEPAPLHPFSPSPSPPSSSHSSQLDTSSQHSVASGESATVNGNRTAFPMYPPTGFGAQNR